MTFLRRSRAALLSLLLFTSFFLFLAGCSNEEKDAVSACIDEEFKPLKSSNTDEISAYFSEAGLLSDLPEGKLPEDVADVFLLFFQNFDYSIKMISIDEDAQTASALLELQTIDAKALAKDFAAQTVVKELQNQAMPSRVEYSLEDYYLLLRRLLLDKDYGTVKSEYTVSLEYSGGEWILIRNDDLENELTGNFVTYGADPDLLSSEEVIALYFDTIKSFDTEQMNRFLSLDELFSADDEYKRTIARALADQILQYLDYSVTSSENSGTTSQVTVEVTTCDWNNIIQKYQEEVSAYTSTSQALADGMSVRLTKANQMLLDCIDNNTSSAVSTVTLTLENDGTNWKLQTNDTFVKAILGNIQEAVANISTSPET
ncbi:MAG: hypothetical protein ACOX8H_08375 [Ruminococcus sp.]|jgi:hypothetical protein